MTLRISCINVKKYKNKSFNKSHKNNKSKSNRAILHMVTVNKIIID